MIRFRALRSATVGAALAAAGSCAIAQDLTVSGFVSFEAAYGTAYDLERVYNSDWVFFDPFDELVITSAGQIQDLDFGTDARLNFDYSNATKSGLEYGAHLELDFYASDREFEQKATQLPEFLAGPLEDIVGISVQEVLDLVQKNDYLGPRAVEFNDGYVFINSALGNVKLGDTGSAGLASNQLNVPYLAPGALEIGAYDGLEKAQLFYSNSFVGVDFEASVDDDSNWALGLGYAAAVGGVDIDLGLSVGEESLAASIGAAIGGLSFGVNYAMEEVGYTSEYIASGIQYSMGALTIGGGVETEIRHGAKEYTQNPAGLFPVMISNRSGEEFESNFFVGARYELADGLTFALGVANLDSDSTSNTSADSDLLLVVQSPPGGLSGRGFDFNNLGLFGGKERRDWVAGASVKVEF